MNNLGYVLMNGTGLPVDQAAARVWFKRAADSREPTPTEAMLNYAELCEKGVGGPRDLDEALVYYKKAAARGQPGAAEHVQRILRSTHPAAGAPAPPILNPQLPDTWYLYATNCHHGAGACQGVVDLEQAAAHYRKATDMKHLLAPAALAALLEDELKNPHAAFQAWLRAAEDGHPPSYARLAHCHAYGHGTARNEAQALKYQRCFDASLGNPESWHRFERHPPAKAVPINLQHGRELCEWEESQHLTFTALTLQERIQRFMLDTLETSSSECDKGEMREMMNDLFAMTNAPPIQLGNSTSCRDEAWWPLLQQRAAAGFKTAKAVVRCQRMHGEAATQLMQHIALASNPTHPLASDSELPFEMLPAATMHSVLRDLHLAHREFDLPILSGPQFSLFTMLAEEALKRDATDADGLLWLARHFKGSAEERVARWQHVIRLHPHDATAHHSLACCYGFGSRPDWRALIRHLELAIDYDGGAHSCVPSWLYDLAGGMRMLIGDEDEDEEEGKQGRRLSLNKPRQLSAAAIPHVQAGIEQYQLYLSRAPVDDRKVPEAHYCMGTVHLHLGDNAHALQQWHKGQDAERVRLPCLHPVGADFPPKHLLQLVQRTFSHDSSSSSLPSLRARAKGASAAAASSSPASQLRCAACQYSGSLPLHRCCGSVVYCDVQC